MGARHSAAERGMLNSKKRTPERWQSGRMRRFAKPLYGLTPVPRVRIPPSPPSVLYGQSLDRLSLGLWLFCGCFVVLGEFRHRNPLVLRRRVAVPLSDRDGGVPHELPQGHEIYPRHGHPTPVGVAEIVQPEIKSSASPHRSWTVKLTAATF